MYLDLIGSSRITLDILSCLMLHGQNDNSYELHSKIFVEPIEALQF